MIKYIFAVFLHKIYTFYHIDTLIKLYIQIWKVEITWSTHTRTNILTSLL